MALLPEYRWLEPGDRIPEGTFLELRDGTQIPSSRTGEIVNGERLYMVPISQFPEALKPSPRARCLTRSYRPQETSLQAKDSQKEKAPLDKVRVLQGIMRECAIGGGIRQGATCDELESSLMLSHQTTSARVRDLAKGGRIVDSGKRRRTRTGRQAIVWTVVEKGPEA